MDNLKISTVQFENKSGDKAYNLSLIDNLAEKASLEGSDINAFHTATLMQGNQNFTRIFLVNLTNRNKR